MAKCPYLMHSHCLLLQNCGTEQYLHTCRNKSDAPIGADNEATEEAQVQPTTEV